MEMGSARGMRKKGTHLIYVIPLAVGGRPLGLCPGQIRVHLRRLQSCRSQPLLGSRGLAGGLAALVAKHLLHQPQGSLLTLYQLRCIPGSPPEGTILSAQLPVSRFE